MTIEQMTPEEEVRLRLAAGISPSTPTEYMLKHIPLWVKMSILRRNTGTTGGGDTPTPKKVTTYNFTTNTYRKNGSTVSLGDVSEFIRLSSATEWQDGNLVEVSNNIPRISGEGLLIEPQATNFIHHSTDISNSYWTKSGTSVVGRTLTQNTSTGTHALSSPTRSVPQYNHTRTQSMSIRPMGSKYIGLNFTNGVGAAGFVVDASTLEYFSNEGSRHGNLRNVPISSSGGVLSISYTIDDIGGWNTSGNSVVAVQFYNAFSVATASRSFAGDGVTSVEVLYVGANKGDVKSSEIITSDSPATRSPDILNIPILPTQTITGDWDEGVTHSLGGGLVTFTGHGRIRTITVEEL